jgi:hypothetical protein
MNGDKLYTNPDMFSREKQSSLSGLFISYKENKSVVNTILGATFLTAYFLCNIQMGPIS